MQLKELIRWDKMQFPRIIPDRKGDDPTQTLIHKIIFSWYWVNVRWNFTHNPPLASLIQQAT